MTRLPPAQGRMSSILVALAVGLRQGPSLGTVVARSLIGEMPFSSTVCEGDEPHRSRRRIAWESAPWRPGCQKHVCEDELLRSRRRLASDGAPWRAVFTRKSGWAACHLFGPPAQSSKSCLSLSHSALNGKCGGKGGHRGTRKHGRVVDSWNLRRTFRFLVFWGGLAPTNSAFDLSCGTLCR